MTVYENSRYKKTYIIQTENGERYLSNRQPINTSVREDDIFHTVKPGDMLDLLAFNYYNDETLYWIIADYNQISFPLDLEVGRVLRLPSLETITMNIMED